MDSDVRQVSLPFRVTSFGIRATKSDIQLTTSADGTITPDVRPTIAADPLVNSGDRLAMLGDRCAIPGGRPAILGGWMMIPDDRLTIPDDRPTIPGDSRTTPGDRLTIIVDRPNDPARRATYLRAMA